MNKINSMRNTNVNYTFWIGLALMMVLLFTKQAHAGTDGTEFDDIESTLTGWMQGTFGRIIAGGMVLVGIIGGIARQSLMAFATGVGGGIGIYNTPTIIENIVTATVANADKAAPALIELSNGLVL